MKYLAVALLCASVSACGGAAADTTKREPPPVTALPDEPEPLGFWVLVETVPPQLYHETEKAVAQDVAAQLGVKWRPVEVLVREAR